MSKSTNSFSFIDEAVNFLKENKQKNFTSKEIAKNLVKKFPDETANKIERSTKSKNEDACITQLAAEISARKSDLCECGIYVSSDRPMKFSFDPDAEQKSTESSSSNEERHNNHPEKELYPVLSKFCKTLGIKTLRIDEHSTAEAPPYAGKGANKWLHPDVVGFQDITKGFGSIAKECLILSAESRGLFYSFEVKDDLLTMSNLREYFFQTVSNSSWANFSYLVSMKHHDKSIQDNVWREVQLLCTSFKIGFIELNKENPSESEIKIMAPQTDVDWGMINRIAVTNKDFQQYLEFIKREYKRQTDEDVAKPDWDNEV